MLLVNVDRCNWSNNWLMLIDVTGQTTG